MRLFLLIREIGSHFRIAERLHDQRQQDGQQYA